ncbi:MAG: hypothetical protein JWM73_2310, partial [Solirubrobacterales bacterium]|nr:hypothetical protein [Solirubrobacterales bacterium]
LRWLATQAEGMEVPGLVQALEDHAAKESS